MQLFFRKYGQGKPIIILHGLFGQCDNWQTQAKLIAEQGFEVYTVDQRNHGLSPHDVSFNYKVMSADIEELIVAQGLKKVILLGHSMGGKTAMHFAIDYTEKVDKLIVVDIGIKYYPPHHAEVVEALKAVSIHQIKSRKEAEVILSKYINDVGTKQFLLKNIYWKTDSQLDWRFNLDVIEKNVHETGAEIESKKVYTNNDFKTLFIRGEKSNYILDADIPEIRTVFPDAEFSTIQDAAHWPHAENPKQFTDEIMRFIKS